MLLGRLQELLDEREAELYETDEAVRDFEARVLVRERETSHRMGAQPLRVPLHVPLRVPLQVREREIRTVEHSLGCVQATMFQMQREIGRLESISSISDGATGEDDLGGGDEEARADRMLELRALKLRRAAAGPGKAYAASAADSDYVHFHTLCLSIKLSLSGQPRLRNVLIDELWEEAKRLDVPMSDWRSFVR